MKKNIIVFTIIFFITIGFATVNTVLDIKGNINISENLDDFKIEITNLIINNADKKDLIAKNKESFTFVGSGNDSIKYTVTNYSYQYDAKVNLVCTPSDNVTVNQIDNLEAQSKKEETITSTSTNEIICTLSIEKVSRTEYAEDMCEYQVGTTWNFNYTGGEQTFITPCKGNYKLETWGAQGGGSNSTYIGGYGGYSSGIASLKKNVILYINSGGMGATNASAYSSVSAKGGYNGGGTAIANSGVNHLYGAGGGATHISLKSGLLSALKNDQDNILIVSGGGGGGRWQSNYNDGRYGYGGHGGGFNGVYGTEKTNPNGAGGGTQSGSLPGGNPGSFGMGSNSSVQGAGGGGFYGGASSGTGGGGSGYIGNPLLTNKVMYCYKCTESSVESTKTISTTCVSSNPTVNCVKQGHGYARVTYLGN